MTVKLDIENAYDILEQSFIKCLYGICFGEIWVNWIKKCPTTTMLTMLVNEKPQNPLAHARYPTR